MPSEIHPEAHPVTCRRRPIRASWLLRWFHFFHRRRAHAALEIGPVLLLETIDTDPSSRRARIHAAIERFIALAHLLPFMPPVAFDELRHQLLGSDLFEVLLAVLRKVAVACRKRHAAGKVLVGGPLEAQPTVQLFLRHAGVDRPNATTRLILAPNGPTSTGEAAPSSAGARESPLITSTRPR